MLIVGAKGFAKEIIEVCHQNKRIENLVLFDNVSADIGSKLYDNFPILKTFDEAEEYFKTLNNNFTLGLGNPILRYKLRKKFQELGGLLVSTTSSFSQIGSYGVELGKGCNIFPGISISNDVKIGDTCIIYFNTIITHDCIIGDYVEISPSVTVLGRVSIGSFSQIGAGSTILPDVKIGENVIVGAGAVVTEDVPDNSLVVGTPAKFIKDLPHLPKEIVR